MLSVHLLVASESHLDLGVSSILRAVRGNGFLVAKGSSGCEFLMVGKYEAGIEPWFRSFAASSFR